MKIRASALCLMFAAFAVVSVAGQGPASSTPAGKSAAAKSWPAPKTAWGDPDIGGTWSSDDLRGVPMQRPDEFGNRAQLTDEEFAKRDAQNEQARRQELNRV